MEWMLLGPAFVAGMLFATTLLLLPFLALYILHSATGEASREQAQASETVDRTLRLVEAVRASGSDFAPDRHPDTKDMSAGEPVAASAGLADIDEPVPSVFRSARAPVRQKKGPCKPCLQARKIWSDLFGENARAGRGIF